MLKFLRPAVTILAMAGIAFLAACGGKHDTGTSPSRDIPNGSRTPSAGQTTTPGQPASSQPVSVDGSGICTDRPIYGTPSVFTYCVLESSFGLRDNRAQTVPAAGGEWTIRFGVNAASGGYLLDQIFNGAENNDGAVGGNGVPGPYNDMKFVAGESVITITLKRGDGCGRDQEDFAAVVNGVRVPLFAVVFNFPESCPTCADLRLQMNRRDAGKTVTVTPTWHGGGTAALNWGDGPVNISGIRSGETYSHTFAGDGPYTVAFDVTLGDITCPNTFTVSFGPTPNPTPTPTPTPGPEPSCKDFPPPAVSVTLGTPAVSLTPTSFSVTGIPVTASPDVSGTFVPALPYGPVPRPAYGQPNGNAHLDYNWSFAYTPAEGLTCQARGTESIDIAIPAKDPTCGDFVAPQISFGPAVTTLLADRVIVESISASPAGGVWSGTFPLVYQRRPAGGGDYLASLGYVVGYGPEGLGCTTSATTSVNIPEQEPVAGNFCFYEIKGGSKAEKCVARGGEWENWNGGSLHNHCRIPFPGISDDDFNLNPEQSAEGCLSKHDS